MQTSQTTKRLQRLNLARKRLTRFPEATEIGTAVINLDLSWNDVTDIPDSVSNWAELQVLLLANNKLQNVTNLSRLAKLKELDLSANPDMWKPQECLIYLKKLEKLNLCNCQLTTIDSITTLTSLKVLDLSHNPLRKLPADLPTLTTLTKIHIDHCGLTKIETDFTQLTSLEELYLSHNPLQRLPKGFSNLTNLKELDIHECALTEIETELTQLTSLEELNLSWNPVQRLPKGFSNLTNLKELDIHECALTEIETELTQLTSLEELNLSHNPLQRLPKGFSNLTNLEKLDIHECALTEIETELTQLTSLEELNLSHNPLQRLPKGFSNLTNLKKLDISKCRLTKIETDFTQLTSLKELNLSWNPLQRLPKGFSNLTNLKELDICECRLTEIETDFTQLASLEELNLSQNPLQRLPKGFSDLTNLKKLDISWCTLTEIETDFTQLTSLEELNLSRNPLQRLPKGISSLTNLKELDICKCMLKIETDFTQLTSLEEIDLSWNPLHRLTKGFSNLTNLKKLDISKCRLTEIETDFTQLTSLEELNLSWNPVQRLPKGFSNLTNLKKLDIRRCELTEIETDFTQLTSLEELYLSQNPLQRLPKGISSLTNLKELDICECRLTEIETDFSQLTSLEELNLSQYPLQRLPKEFSNLTNLKKLDICECRLTEIETDFSQLTSLEELNLSRNPLQRLPKGFSNLTNLKKLDISNCRLTEIETDFSQLTSLEELNLSRNPLQRLPKGFSNLTNLKKLDISNCRLTEIETDFTQLTSLKELYLSWNPLQRLPKGLSNSYLLSLGLDHCGLTEVPEQIMELAGLKVLCLECNNLTRLPLGITKLKNLETMLSFGNPLTTPPSEVCNQGVDAIFNYLSEIRLGEALHGKIVLLGSSGAGKTSLARTLIYNESSCVGEDDRTILLHRSLWETSWEGKNLSATVIDFGGNEWYKIVHHLFIEEQSLYLHVVKLSEYCNENFSKDVESWLSTLLTRVPNATFMMVATHADECTQEDIKSKTEAIRGHICRKLGKNKRDCLLVRVVSSKTMLGIPELRDELLGLVYQKSRTIPANWLELYKELQSSTAQKEPYYTLQMVRNLDEKTRKVIARGNKESQSKETRKRRMVEAENPKTRLEFILQFFHEIGAILWFKQTTELSQFVFHNPDYLTTLMKAIFTERLEAESLDYSNFVFQAEFTYDMFQHVKKNLLREGIMPRTVLRCLWQYKELDDEVFEAMIHLFEQLGLCYRRGSDEDGRATSLRFPWFLTEAAPEDAHVEKIFYGLPEVRCHRITQEYVFVTMYPPPLYEEFAVRMHHHIKDANSRIDWKDGAFAAIRDSRVLLRRRQQGSEIVISLTVEGEDVADLWVVLTGLAEDLESCIKKWKGLKCDVWLVCPHCLQLGHENPGKFLMGKSDKSCRGMGCYVTCARDLATKVPSCLVYQARDLDALPKHQQALDEFNKKLWSNTSKSGVRIVGLNHVESGELDVPYLNNLVQWSESVGIIPARNFALKECSGTVFRVGPCHVMTCWHVVEQIYELLDTDESCALSGNHVKVCFNHHRPSVDGEQQSTKDEEPHETDPLVWHDNELDAAVLQLKQPTDHQLPGPLKNKTIERITRNSPLHLIGHSEGKHKKVNLFCEPCLPDHPDVKKLRIERGDELRQNCPNLLNPEMVLMKSSFMPGSSGSPGFDNSGNLVVMLTAGVFKDSEYVFRQGVSLKSVHERLVASKIPGLH